MVGSETDRGIILRRKKKKPDYRVRYLGLVDYDTAHAYQLKLHAERVAGNIPDTLLLMEHRPVITMGRRGGTGNLLVPPEELAVQLICLIFPDPLKLANLNLPSGRMSENRVLNQLLMASKP